MTGVFSEVEMWTRLDTDLHIGAIACEDKDREWGSTFTIRGRPTLASKPPGVGEKREAEPSLVVLRRNQPILPAL